MLKIPEYLSLRARDQLGDKVAVSVRIDGETPMPPINMRPDVLARLLEAFSHGNLDFMSFDEHPKRLMKITLPRKGERAQALLEARSLTGEDEFPQDWETADPQVYGADPWNGQMR